MKIIASENEINPTRTGPQCIRIGWANAMFVAGCDTDVIKRWGRWEPARFATYLRNGDRVLAGVGRGMMLAAGLLPQLQRQSGDDRNKERRISDGKAGGKDGWGRPSDPRMFQISKKVSQLCRHDERIYRQRNGFAELAEILNHRDMGAFPATQEDANRIAHGDGGNFKKRFEFGQMEKGRRDIMTSQGHSAHSGVTTDYLEDIGCPGLVLHGKSLGDTRSICAQCVGRMGRLRIHLGRMITDRRAKEPNAFGTIQKQE